MGTRSLVHFWDETGDVVLTTICRQYDGYPECRGLMLAKFLTDIRMVNGIPVSIDTSMMANGIGCLAAQWIAVEKEGVGGVYIYAAGADDCGEEYVYNVRLLEDDTLEVEVICTYSDSDSPYFKGAPADLVEFIKAVSVEESAA